MLSKNDLSLKENNSHGDCLLPIMLYNCNLPKDFSYLPLHWHEQMEFTIIRDGSATYNINLNSYDIKKGDIIILSPFCLHDINLNNSPSMVSDTFVFSMSMLDIHTADSCSIKYLTPINDGLYDIPPIITPSDNGYDELLSLFNELYTTYNNKYVGFELIIKSILFRLINCMFKNNLVHPKTNISSDNTNINKLKIVLDYIHHNLSNKITVASLAALCSYSEYYFMNFFKKYTGMTCTQYINAQRLDLAAFYLRNKNISIMDIAMEVGFDNISYFNKRFKETYNMTPKEYRNISKLTDPSNYVTINNGSVIKDY